MMSEQWYEALKITTEHRSAVHGVKGMKCQCQKAAALQQTTEEQRP